jgi:hypothetical protein
MSLYLTYGLQMIGDDEVNAYSVWIHDPDRGQMPLVGLKMTREDAEDAIETWAAMIAADPHRLDGRTWFPVWCGKGQVVV